MALTIAITVLVFLTTLAGVRLFINWSFGRRILDVPNERSSHSKPVPVGAGVVIAGTVLAAFTVSEIAGSGVYALSTSGYAFLAYCIGAVLIVAVSWLDDLRRVPVGIRFLIHAFAAVLLLAAAVSWKSALPAPVSISVLVSFLWIVGLTNAYNFMDGIDGIAGIQGVAAGIGWVLAGIVFGIGGAVLMGAAITAACAAYLVFNWQPAKVFMGDAGSAFLGYTLAAIPILAMESVSWPTGSGQVNTAGLAGLLSIFAIAFVWPFVFDSSFTFFRRVLNRERVWEPHRSHLYQRMVLYGRSHAAVSALYGALGAVCGAAAILSGGSYIVCAAVLGLCSVVLIYFTRNRASAGI
jgi:UDP-N-acetylmuramyl pentapeptide phosphotransferase/UDP-N-acetylglucosamine-1-phosphate transferase